MATVVPTDEQHCHRDNGGGYPSQNQEDENDQTEYGVRVVVCCATDCPRTAQYILFVTLHMLLSNECRLDSKGTQQNIALLFKRCQVINPPFVNKECLEVTSLLKLTQPVQLDQSLPGMVFFFCFFFSILHRPEFSVIITSMQSGIVHALGLLLLQDKNHFYIIRQKEKKKKKNSVINC